MLSNVSSLLANEAADKYLVFSWIDYSIFSLMLVISTIIGIYFGFFSKQDTTADYLMGGKKMTVGPVAVSITASCLSGITVLGVPSEMYMYGTSYWLFVGSASIVILITSYIFLPVFFKLQLYSSFEYLQLRFNNSSRVFCSFLYTVAGMMYIPVVIYIPALAFSQVTGVNIHHVTPIVCVICIFYTTIGGLRAVVWTDTLQGIVMLIAMIVVLCLGLKMVGTPLYIWQKAQEGGRIDFFNMDPSLTVRSSFLTISVGLTTAWVGYVGLNQGTIQKFLSLPKLTDARKALYLFGLGIVLVKSISCFTGLLMYVHYKDCDPYTEGKVKRPDQLLAYYVMEVATAIPGLPGLFVAGVFSAALSTMSACMNTMAGTIYEDFISPLMPANTTEARASNIMKLTVVIIGTICVALVFIVEHLGAVLQLSLSLSGITIGPMIGLFALGILFPWANAKGALLGGIASLAFVSWIVVGAQVHIAQGNIKFPPLPLSTEGCAVNNSTLLQSSNNTALPLIDSTADEEPDVFYLFRLSFLLYAPTGALAVLFVGLIVSWITGWQDLSELNPDLIAPIMQKYLPEKTKKSLPQDYCSVEQALENIKKQNSIT